MDNKVSCIVVCYNPSSEVVKNIETYINFVDKVIIVDNSDIDNSTLFSELKEKYHLIYLPLFNNTGIAHALNVGVAKSIELNFEYIITMDQDSCFYNNLVEVYKEFIQHNDIKNIAALSPSYKTDRVIQLRKNSSLDHEEKLITMQSGTLFFSKKFEIIGKFNEDLFLDVVDWEYFFRLHKLGFKTIQCNKAILQHAPAESLPIFKFRGKQFSVGVASPLRYYYQIRNLLWCILNIKSYFMLKTIAYKFFKIVFLFDNKKEYLAYAMKAIKDAFKGNLGIYKD